MKRVFLIGLISLLPLTACGGGGSSVSSFPNLVYPMSGKYEGTVSSSVRSTQFAIVVDDNSGNPSGEFAIQDTASNSPIGAAWNSSMSYVNGNDLTVNGTDENGCDISIHGTMQTSDDLNGTLTVSNCGPGDISVTFYTTRYSNIQDVLRKVPALSKYMKKQ